MHNDTDQARAHRRAGTRNEPIYVRLLESKRATSAAVVEIIFFFIGVAIAHHYLPKFGIHDMTYWDTFWVAFAFPLMFSSNLSTKITDRA